jgi:ribosomal protein S8
MGTSLTGKALNFGFSDCGFESRVPNITTSPINYCLNLINLHLKKKSLYVELTYSNKTLFIVKILCALGYLSTFYIVKSPNRVFIYARLTYLKNFKKPDTLRLISKPSKSYYCSITSLKFLSKYIGTSSLVISTSSGILRHQDCVRYRLGGKIICII